jgi:thioredoxin reductase (NADPH)
MSAGEAVSTLATRRPQMFPSLSPAEVARLRRFGETRRFAGGERLYATGEVGPGMFVVLSGRVQIVQTRDFAAPELVIEQGPGGFLAEVGQLAGRPSLVDAIAVGDVEALVVSPASLRALLIAEAELGEEIMRALILRRVALIESGGGGPVIIGPEDDADVVRLTGFLTRWGHPHHLLDSDLDQDAGEVIDRFHVDISRLPAVVCPSGQVLMNPSEAELASCLGILTPLDPERVYDVVIVGAGPAGLATAVYAGSEGLSVLVIDQKAHGGQAGASARIENYFGFPTGITGHALVSRAYNQAQKFGVESAIPAQVEAMESLEGTPEGADARFRLSLADGQRVRCQAVVVASGVRYHRPDILALKEFEGSSAHFWASPIEARLCHGQEVVLVGGGNSAGQAVVYLASRVEKVWMLVRGDGLAESMSQYLVERISGLANVELLTRTEITDLEGEHGALTAVHWRTRGQEPVRRELRHLFLFTGAEPNTDWLARCHVRLDSKGFVLTGRGVDEQTLPLETSVNGIFAIGDVRSGSTKRVASAVGEGAQVVATLHRFLADPDAVPISS